MRFLTELNMDDAQLNSLATTAGLTTAGASSLSPITAIGQALQARKLVLLEQQPTAKPVRRAVEEAPTQPRRDKPPSLGPHDRGGYSASRITGVGTTVLTNEGKAEETPLCILESVSIRCNHGRTVVITKESKIVPNLDVIATQTSKPGFDLITAEIHASELCPTHKRSPK